MPLRYEQMSSDELSKEWRILKYFGVGLTGAELIMALVGVASARQESSEFVLFWGVLILPCEIVYRTTVSPNLRKIDAILVQRSR